MKSDRTHALWTNLNFPHFITATTQSRTKIFLDDVCARQLIEEWRFYEKCYKIQVIAGVVMPDHFHIIIHPQEEKTFSDFMHGVKGHFAKWYGEEMVKRGMGAPPIEMGEGVVRQRVPKIWQDSFFDFLIPDQEIMNQKIEYILQNPIEEQIVVRSNDYPHIILHDDYR